MKDEKIELFIMRVLAGYDPISSAKLPISSPWNNAQLKEALRRVVEGTNDQWHLGKVKDGFDF
tara:strand:- start:311 stop:499 length:189 start_codon:yes stop_codon:yes gene_type:complete